MLINYGIKKTYSNNEYVFLECNPNGQWGWIEDELNLPMSEALVDCLLNRICV